MPKLLFTPETVPVRGPEDAELEANILERLQKLDDALEGTLMYLASLYTGTGRPMEAVPHLEGFALFTQDRDKRALIFLSLGQLLEQANHPDQAPTHY